MEETEARGEQRLCESVQSWCTLGSTGSEKKQVGFRRARFRQCGNGENFCTNVIDDHSQDGDFSN